MGISDYFQDLWNKTQTKSNAILTKKRYTRKERRYAHRYNEIQSRIERNANYKILLDVYYCFPHHDALVRLFGRKGANYLGAGIKDSGYDLDFAAACANGASILSDAGIVNCGFAGRNR